MKIYGTCEVQSYWGEWVSYGADLIAFRTKRNGQPVVRYRWRSECGSARTIPGSFPTVERALDAVRASHIARDCEDWRGM